MDSTSGSCNQDVAGTFPGVGEESIIKLTQLKFNLNCLFELSFENILFEICMGGHFWERGFENLENYVIQFSSLM